MSTPPKPHWGTAHLPLPFYSKQRPDLTQEEEEQRQERKQEQEKNKKNRIVKPCSRLSTVRG